MIRLRLHIYFSHVFGLLVVLICSSQNFHNVYVLTENLNDSC